MQGQKIGFLPELQKRMKEPANRYRETEATTGCLCCKKQVDVAGNLSAHRPIAYNAGAVILSRLMDLLASASPMC